MSYEEEFDRIIREKVEQQHYPFEESSWTKASKLISQSRRGGWNFKWIAMSGAALMIAGTGYFVLPGALVSEHTQVTKHEVRLTPPEKNNAVVNETVISQEQTGHSEKSKTSEIPVRFDAHEKQGMGQVAAVSVHQEPISGIPVSTNSKYDAEEQQANIPEQLVSDGSSPVSGDGALAGADDISAVLTENNDAEYAAETFLLRSETELSDPLSKIASFLYYQSTDKEISPVLSAIPVRDEDYYRKTNRSIFYLDLLAGGAYNLGWEKYGSTDAKGWNWYGGMDFGFFLNRRLSLSAGIQAFNLSHIEKPFHVVKATSYDFSSAHSKTVMTCSQLQFFGVPVKVNYHLPSGDVLSVGVIGAQLWRADNNIENTVTRDNSVIWAETSSNHKLYEGMTQQNLLLSVGYGLSLSARLRVNAEIIYGITDLYKGGSGYTTGKETPLMGRFGLSWRLVQK